MQPSWRKHDIDRRFLLVSALRVEDAQRTAADLAKPIDLVVTSPTDVAREAAASVVRNRWVFTVEEPLLAPRESHEAGADVVARLAGALRSVRAHESNVSLVVCDTLDVLGASVFVLDDEGVMHVADALEAFAPVS
jgi:broad specificity phosphatase PhoE